ncbi:MAG TPA: hypothetical protein VFE32_01805 [Puia sp.]|jgi:hypothetical protein|nr:hypothetical protein [Puia sp.]
MKTENENRKRPDIRRTTGSVGKKLFIILFSLGLAYGASAQRGVGHGYVGGGFHGAYHPYYAPRVYYAPSFYGGWGLGWGLGYGFGWGVPGWYGPWVYPYGYPPYYYGHGPNPPALQDQIDGIKSDYKAQIKDVKHDKALSHKDKKAKINDLEKQRDAAITEARHDFYNNQRRNSNGQPQRYNNDGQPDKSNSNGQ